jgi:hypothetical protein
MASKPIIHGVQKPFSASNMLDSVGDAIGRIKSDAGLTYTDIGAAFGKSEDVAASYRAGHSDMPLSAFIRGVAALGDDVGNAALAFIGRRLAPIEAPEATSDHDKISPAAQGVATLAAATCPTSPGGATITDCELLARAAEIEANYQLWDELRHRLNAARVARRAGVA